MTRLDRIAALARELAWLALVVGAPSPNPSASLVDSAWARLTDDDQRFWLLYIDEPELMYLMNGDIALNLDEAIRLLAEPTYVPCERVEATHVLVTKDVELGHVGHIYPIRKRDMNDVIVDLGGGVCRVIYEGEHEWRRLAAMANGGE